MSDANTELNSAATEQTRQVRLRMDERNKTTHYANAFRTSASAEEVIVDFGLNQTVPGRPEKDGKQPTPEILFEINSRLVMNFYTAKRLALTLGQIVHHHEQQFGELKINPAERARPGVRGN